MNNTASAFNPKTSAGPYLKNSMQSYSDIRPPHIEDPGLGDIYAQMYGQPTIVVFIDTYRKGPLHSPTLVSSLLEFETLFGGPDSQFDNRASMQVKQFFVNGGLKAFINRIELPVNRAPIALDWIAGINDIKQFDFNLLVMPGLALLEESEASKVRQSALELVALNDAFFIIDPPQSRWKATDNVGFVDTYSKGPINVPTLISSFSEFEQIYGLYDFAVGADNRGHQQVLQFFSQGGHHAWINRIKTPQTRSGMWRDWIGEYPQIMADSQICTGMSTGAYSFQTQLDYLILGGLNNLDETAGGILKGRNVRINFGKELLSDDLYCGKNAVNFANTKVVTGPPGLTINELTSWRDELNNPGEKITQYAATYFNRVLIADPLSQQARFLEASASLAGIMIKKESEIGIWAAPANVGIVQAEALEYLVSDIDQHDLNLPLNGLAINVIRSFPDYGIRIWGARTMAGNSKNWHYINVRRTASKISHEIKSILLSYAFVPNNAETWAAVNITLTKYLTSLWKNGTLSGAITNEAFSIQVGLGSTMTAEDISHGNMKVDVQVALEHPAEFTDLQFQQPMNF